MAKRCYRCENEFGSDPCEFARGNRVIAEQDLPPALDGGIPKCPGKTLSGATCGKPLVGPFPLKQGWPWARIAIFGGAALGVLALGAAAIWLFTADEPRLVIVSEPVVFSQGGSEETIGTLRIRNDGSGDLNIAGIDLSPASFTAPLPTSRIPPGESTDVTIHYAAGPASPGEGTLTLRSNDSNSPRKVLLMVSRDPWWVYDRLESTSTILSKKP
jgi:hypothetical protein